MEKIDNGTEETMEKIDNGMEETLKDMVNGDWIQPFRDNAVKTLSAILLDIFGNPTFKRFIEPSINLIKGDAKTKALPAGITLDMCKRAIYTEGIMKFCLCTPEECKKVVFKAVSNAKNYTDANEEIRDQESFYNIVRVIALERFESKVRIKISDTTFVNMLYKHNKCGVFTKLMVDIENTRMSLYDKINLNNY